MICDIKVNQTKISLFFFDFIARSFRICPRSVPDISSCVKQSIENLSPFLKTGDFGDGFKVEGIDPLKLDDISIRRPNLSSNITQLISYGSGTFVIEKIKVNFDKPSLDLIINVPKSVNIGNYENEFRFGWLNAKAKGKMTSWLGNLKIRIGFKGRLETRNGQKYIKMDTFFVAPKITQIKIYLENVSPDKTFNEVINTFLNQNVEVVAPEIENSIKNTLRESKYF